MRFQRNGIETAKISTSRPKLIVMPSVKAELEKRRRDGPESRCEVRWLLKL